MSGGERVELDPPEALILRWGLLAAISTALGDPLASFSPGRANTDDSGGNWSELVIAGEGRFGFFGLDHEYSATADEEADVDLLEGGPGWLPLERLKALAQDDQLGWCYWFEHGQWWRSVSAARSGLNDGHTQAAKFLIEEDQMMDWLDGLPSGSGGTRMGADVAERLLERARAQVLSVADLRTALTAAGLEPGDVELTRGLKAAAAAGLTSPAPGSSPSPTPPSSGQLPTTRPRRRLSEGRHAEIVIEAMRGATELTRPVPPDNRLEAEIEGFLNEHGLLGARTPAYHIDLAGGPWSGSMYGPVQIERDVFEAFTAQVLALRSDELAQRRGGWLYLQIVHTPSRWRLGSSRLTLERAYDHLPAWWGLSPFSGDRLTDLAEEIEGREPAFRPEWARLLDPAVAAEFR